MLIKKLSGLLLLSSIVFLSSCIQQSNTKPRNTSATITSKKTSQTSKESPGPSKIDLAYGDLHASLIPTSFPLLQERFYSKDAFMLAVPYSEDCSCWINEVKPVIEQFVIEKHVPVYFISNEILVENSNQLGLVVVKDNVTFAIFDNGEIANQITSRDYSLLKSYSSFEKYLDSLVTLPRIFYVSLDDINNLYQKDEKNIIYFSRGTCGDCTYLNSHGLLNWSKKNPNYKKPIYIFDCDQVRYNEDGLFDEVRWQAFKDDYGLSIINNPIYGYNSGYVPMFVYLKGSNLGVSYLSGCVAFNDTVEAINEEYVVIDSYYTQERLNNLSYIDSSVKTKVLKGMKLTRDDVTIYDGFGDYVLWNHESAEQYHNVFLEKFLNYCENH